MYFIVSMLCSSSDDDPLLIEWEFFPHVGPRPSKGFVGLKNAGATCYMNAVLQQVSSMKRSLHETCIYWYNSTRIKCQWISLIYQALQCGNIQLHIKNMYIYTHVL